MIAALGPAVGLRRRFLAIIFGLFLLTAFAAFLAFRREADLLTEQLGAAYAGKYALANRSLIQEPLTREIALSRQLADSPTIKSWAAAEADPERRRRALVELESYRRRLAENSWFCVIDSSRHYYFDDRTHPFGDAKLAYTLERAAAKDYWYFASIKEVKDYALNVNYDAVLDVRKVWINVVMRDDDGRPLGMTGTGLDLSGFLHSFIDTAEPGVENVLLDRNLAIQAHRNRDLIDQHSVAKDPEQRSTFVKLLDLPDDSRRLQAALDKLRAGSTAETLFLTMDGKRHLVGASYLPALDWYVLSILDLDEVLGRRIFLALFSIGGIIALLLVVVVGWAVNALVLSPLTPVTDAARKIAGGDYEVSLVPGRRDEIGTLTLAFAQMTATIKSHTRELAERVRERTAELTDANTALQAEALERQAAQDALAEKVTQLENAMATVKQLEGIIPICSYCKKIRDDQSSWQQLEIYISRHSGAHFSHGICPDCTVKFREDLNI